MTYCANTQCSEYGNCDLTLDCPLFKPTSEKQKVNKYQAQKCTYNGLQFDSHKELRRYLELQLLERSGQITGLQRQVKFELIPAQKDEKGKCAERAVGYIADFVYKDMTVIQSVGITADILSTRLKRFALCNSATRPPPIRSPNTSTTSCLTALRIGIWLSL